VPPGYPQGLLRSSHRCIYRVPYRLRPPGLFRVHLEGYCRARPVGSSAADDVTLVLNVTSQVCSGREQGYKVLAPVMTTASRTDLSTLQSGNSQTHLQYSREGRTPGPLFPEAMSIIFISPIESSFVTHPLRRTTFGPLTHCSSMYRCDVHQGALGTSANCPPPSMSVKALRDFFSSTT